VVVNNMPDGAFETTERQYLDLLDAGSGDDVVEVTLTTLAGVPRGERAAARIADRYVPVGALWSDPPDLLIVTGSNPLAPRIEEEPYWPELAGLLSWGRDRVPSMLLSCLSAHAALSVFDGITRTRLPAKCTGVFPQQVDGAHPLAAGLGPSVVLPHSRINAVAPEAVAAAGYRAVLGSEAVGWSVVTKESGACPSTAPPPRTGSGSRSCTGGWSRGVSGIPPCSRRSRSTSWGSGPAGPGATWR
jgi:homoserine O-succinyltransferase